MMLQGLLHRRSRGRGFTLVELAIVLAVASLLFAGLWRLMSAGNAQLRDQAAAEQMNQLLAATRNFLASGNSTSFKNSVIIAEGGTDTCPPIATVPNGCVGNLPLNEAAFASYLPPGFNENTENPYGQKYEIQVRIPNDQKADNYSFMIKTKEGSIIPDASGGRIAAIIGGDGGFIYQGDVCASSLSVAANSAACGSFGGWAIDITDYDFNTGSGYLTARSIGGVTGKNPWLARNHDLGPANAGEYNTMHVPLGFETGVAPINMNGNTINLQEGKIDGGSIDPFDTDKASIVSLRRLVLDIGGATSIDTRGAVPALTVTGQHWGSSPPAPHVEGDLCAKEGAFDGSCGVALMVNGNMSVDQNLTATSLYAGSFIYEVSSDIRLKHDIKPIENALENLGKITGVSFVMNQGKESKLGVIAQEVEKVYPQLIHGIGGDYKGVDYIGLIGPMIAAINELKADNDVLQERLEKQEVEIKRLQNPFVKAKQH